MTALHALCLLVGFAAGVVVLLILDAVFGPSPEE
jgi:hypothetical protein